MFDEQPDGDAHGECAMEIARLKEESARHCEAFIATLRKQIDAIDQRDALLEVLRLVTDELHQLHSHHYKDCDARGCPTGEYVRRARDVIEKIGAGETAHDRRTLQQEGIHPAPCARFCESTAFQIEIRSLKRQLDDVRKAKPKNEARGQWIELLNCRDDFNYLISIIPDKDGLHDWLRARAARAEAASRSSAVPDTEKPG